MSRRPAARWLAVGGAFTGLGGIATLTYWIYVESAARRSFWEAPGYLSVAALAIGLTTLAIGFFAPSHAKSQGQQSQRSGDNSKNYQAGRDMNLRSPRD